MVFSFIINLLWQITTVNHAKLNLEMKKRTHTKQIKQTNKQTNQQTNKPEQKQEKSAVFHLSNWFSVAEKHKHKM